MVHLEYSFTYNCIVRCPIGNLKSAGPSSLSNIILKKIKLKKKLIAGYLLGCMQAPYPRPKGLQSEPSEMICDKREL